MEEEISNKNIKLNDSFKEIREKIDLIREKIFKDRLNQQKDLIDMEKLNELLHKNLNYSKSILKKIYKPNDNINIYKPKYYIPKLRYNKLKNKNSSYISVIDGSEIKFDDNNNLMIRSSSIINNSNKLKNNKKLLFSKSQIDINNNIPSYEQKYLNYCSSYTKIKRKPSPFNKDFYRKKICQLHNKLFEDKQIDCNKTSNLNIRKRKLIL